MWRVFIIHVWLRAFGDAFSKTWMFENTPLFFSARESGLMNKDAKKSEGWIDEKVVVRDVRFGEFIRLCE